MDPTPAELITTTIDQALAIEDPVDRFRATTELLDAVHERRLDLKAARQADVLKLRETLTLREVGHQFGLSTGRVDQIAKGK